MQRDITVSLKKLRTDVSEYWQEFGFVFHVTISIKKTKEVFLINLFLFHTSHHILTTKMSAKNTYNMRCEMSFYHLGKSDFTQFFIQLYSNINSQPPVNSSTKAEFWLQALQMGLQLLSTFSKSKAPLITEL